MATDQPQQNAWNCKEHCEWSPNALGVENVNLKAANGTNYASNVIDLARYSEFLLGISATIVGAVTAGTFKVMAEWFRRDGSTAVYSGTPQDLWTAITPFATTAAGYHVLSFGRDRVAQADVGTVAPLFSALWNTGGMTRFTLNVVAQSDAATSAVGSMFLRAVT